MSIERQICRLCLKATQNEFEEIDGLVKDIFNVLLLRLDMDITKNPIVCWSCLEVAKICLKFKSTCISTEKSVLLSFFTDRQTVKQDIKVLYKETGGVLLVSEKDLHVCRFCLIPSETSNFVSVHALLNDTMFMMLSEYMPEMDFNVTENPIICANCREKLNGYFKFVQNYLDIEEKIKAYYKKEDTENTGQVKLEKLRYSSEDSLEYSDKYPQLWKGMYIKEEYINLGENSYNVGYSDFPFEENEIEKKSNVTSLERREHQSEIKQKDATNLLDTQGSLFNGNISGSKMYRCSSCAYEAKRKCDLTRHMLVHKDISELKMYKCSLCAYKAKVKCYLDQHMLIHKKVTEIKMYKCSLCAYEARRMRNLNSHMLIHKDTSEIKMYKCPLCTYEGKQKSYLDRHMLVHNNIPEIKMYKCSLCPYEAKQKIYIDRHMLVHKNVSEIKMYKCSLCTYETKRRSYLDKHMLVHKDVSEIKMYKCSLCAYEAKRKSYLHRHVLVHKNVSEIKMFKCSLCTYEAKQKIYIRKHMLVHKDVSEIKMYKCSLCTYECKHKCNFNTHLKKHKTVS